MTVAAASRWPTRLGWIRALAGLTLVACAYGAARPPCAACQVESITLHGADGLPVAATLYLPPAPLTRLPAVVVVHGYLANRAFMEVPWAGDLTAAGMAALFIDRRGHGRSAGSWWPVAVDASQPPADLAAALAFLRAHPAVDATRLGILGHSDGATAALVAASLDWEVLATVAISASLAPWQLVSYVAPRNLLLLYGAEDTFVLHDTDANLIDVATRGYLTDAGQYGALGDGSGRRLARIAGAGHVDILFSPAARRQALDWLAASLGVGDPPRHSATRVGWVIGGSLALLVLLAAAPPWRLTGEADAVAGRGAVASLALCALWPLAMAVVPLLQRVLGWVPVQEGWVFVALIAAATVAAGTARVVALAQPRRAPAMSASGGPLPARRGGAVGAQVAVGSAAAALVSAGLGLLLLHFYDLRLGTDRLLIGLAVAGSALPLFWLVETIVAVHAARPTRAAIYLLLAAATAALSRATLVRMSVLPGYLFAAVLVFAAAFPLARRPRASLAAAMFAALLLGRAAAAVCALY